MRLIVRSSPIHAAGVFTLERVLKGTRILEYTGERMAH
jgi:SET domain-containing protein